jgi:phospholipid-binding lipoprotein MlaA
MTSILRYFTILAMLTLASCATSSKNPQDPLEGMNRKVFSFNDKLDQTVIKPAAKTYKAVLPSIVQTGVSNFFGNIGDVSTALNNVLQGRIHDGMSDVTRVAVNTLFGLAGLVDIATPTGLPKHNQDFGQTLGRWGVHPGPYVVLPLLGPSTMRDAVATPVDFETNLWNYKDPVRWRNTGTVVQILGRRADALDESQLLDDAALDRYEFVRDSYLQRRESQIYQGDAAKTNEKTPLEGSEIMQPDSESTDQSRESNDPAKVKPGEQPKSP